MKKQFLLIIITLSTMTGFSQDIERMRFLNDLTTKSMQRTKIAMGTVGTPYITKAFQPALVSGVSQNAMMRYDAYNDQFEFINSSRDTLVLNRLEQYNKVTFTISNTVYKLMDYTKKGEKVNGYLISLFEKNGYGLFKKQNVRFTKEREANNSYDKSLPARYDKQNDTYFFKNGDKGISEMPDSKKGFFKLFPEKKAELESFFKQNDIDLDKEADMIKVLDLLAVSS